MKLSALSGKSWALFKAPSFRQCDLFRPKAGRFSASFQFSPSACQFTESSLDKSSRGLLPRAAQGLLVGSYSLRHLSQSTAQVGLRRIREIVILEITAFQNRLNQLQPLRGAIAHCDRDGTIQLDYGRSIGSQKDIVETGNLSPVGGCC